jgi:predicted O-methyltransferase YrrM
MSTNWFLDNILIHKDSHIDVIDTFQGDTQNKEMAGDMSGTFKRFLENTERNRDKISTFVGFSDAKLLQLIDMDVPQYDIIYIDGSHQQETVLSDAVLSWKLLKTGGIMIFDDYDMYYQDKDGVKYEPRIAIDCFYSCYKEHIQRLHVGWQYILKKT